VVDEQRLAELALTATASQLAVVFRGFRSADGSRIGQQTKRSVSWQQRDDGMIDFWTRLAKEEATQLIAAREAARDQFGPPPPTPDPCGEQTEPSTPEVGSYSTVDAWVDVARGFLTTAPPDRSGEDRAMVVVHVSAEHLAGNVPTGTSQPGEATCHIDGVGSIETATAQKLACDNQVLGAVVDRHSAVLALGRSRRLVGTAQRRALTVRDGMCQYPGCHSIRHLTAHHRLPWSAGGRTDVDNLILLCQWHHTVVHEGGVSITEGSEGWVFTKPDGQPCQPWISDQQLAWHLDSALRNQQQTRDDRLAGVDSFQHLAATQIRPSWAGEPFDLHACVQTLFTIKLPEPRTDNLDQQAA
jgi:Domain of unknown function (DUF222)/HNH endonuclease